MGAPLLARPGTLSLLEREGAAAPEPNPNQAHLVNPTITLTRCTGGGEELGSPDPSPRASEPPGQGGEELGSPDPAPRASEPPGQDHTGRRPLHFVGGEDSSWLSMAGAPLAAAATSHEPGQPRLPAPCWSSLERRPCRFLRCECFTCSCVLIAMGQGMRGGPDPPVVILIISFR